MLILELALVAMLSTKATAPQGQPAKPDAAATANSSLARPFPVVLDETQLPRVIKREIESIAGPGSVDISVDHETLFSARIAVPSFRADIYNPIYDRALELYRLYPDLSFDFYLRLKPRAAAQTKR
jgi:hypothetical protein